MELYDLTAHEIHDLLLKREVSAVEVTESVFQQIDKVEEQIKSTRLDTLQKRQKEISLQKNKEYEGPNQTVMVEGESKNAAGQWSGRTTSNIIVNFDGSTLSIGQEVQVTITEGLPNSLRGVLV